LREDRSESLRPEKITASFADCAETLNSFQWSIADVDSFIPIADVFHRTFGHLLVHIGIGHPKS
jgi:hypothetical protein